MNREAPTSSQLVRDTKWWVVHHSQGTFLLFKNIYNEEEIIVRIAISGGTGFIGKYLSTFLFKKDILFTFLLETKLLKLHILTFNTYNGHQIYKSSPLLY